MFMFHNQVAPDATFTALDRFPSGRQMSLARNASMAHGTKLLICFGGNSRSNGFSQVVQDPDLRSVFIQRLVGFCHKHGLHGVDYNRE